MNACQAGLVCATTCNLLVVNGPSKGIPTVESNMNYLNCTYLLLSDYQQLHNIIRRHYDQGHLKFVKMHMFRFMAHLGYLTLWSGQSCH